MRKVDKNSREYISKTYREILRSVATKVGSRLGIRGRRQKGGKRIAMFRNPAKTRLNFEVRGRRWLRNASRSKRKAVVNRSIVGNGRIDRGDDPIFVPRLAEFRVTSTPRDPAPLTLVGANADAAEIALLV